MTTSRQKGGLKKGKCQRDDIFFIKAQCRNLDHNFSQRDCTNALFERWNLNATCSLCLDREKQAVPIYGSCIVYFKSSSQNWLYASPFLMEKRSFFASNWKCEPCTKKALLLQFVYCKRAVTRHDLLTMKWKPFVHWTNCRHTVVFIFKSGLVTSSTKTNLNVFLLAKNYQVRSRFVTIYSWKNLKEIDRLIDLQVGSWPATLSVVN